jgi:hypothetical protein
MEDLQKELQPKGIYSNNAAAHRWRYCPPPTLPPPRESGGDTLRNPPLSWGDVTAQNTGKPNNITPTQLSELADFSKRLL